ncbi:hypothetical protein H310_08623 [Aphanomyces invadans]|uniref:Uncharacterized protein n=1 Tax=Aphanomyces invadans TaxID=157072 RepID=A0A024TWG0_9STRA|nr:hypothetical protein H310_08623 [Aphanomyces invadans]ETV98485.1 hypothetical protein H310_08623 [Aphanomyces invadans]RHY30523.1 hypothetical protein DYB32_004241 [Aphanomyces invadans]|eukprot:XP_008872682.1 hypothetical protein H310_08623 [Aphanomyces invadans]
MRVHSMLVALAAAVALATADEVAVNTDASVSVDMNGAALKQLGAEIETLKKANADLDAKYQQEREQVAALLNVVDELKVSSADMSAKHDQVVALEADLEALRKASQAAEKNFKENTANLEQSLKTLSAAAKAAEDNRQADKVQATATLKSAEGVVASLTTQLNDANLEVAGLKKRNVELEGQLNNVHADSTAATEQLVALKDTLHAKATSLATENKDLKDKVAELEVQLTADQAQITKLETELKATKAKLGQISTLQAQLKDAKQHILDLQADIKKADAAINWQAVFSAYYDNVANTLEHSDEYVALAKSKSIEIYDNHVHPITLEALKHASTLSSSAHDLYKKHAAEHVDPIVAQVVLAAAPHYAAHAPVVHEFYSKFAEKSRRLMNTADQRFRMTRKWCIGRLKKLYPRIAKYARQIVDFTIFLMVLPLVFAAYRIVVEVISLTLYAATCCCCFGLFGRKPVKHEVAQPVNTSANAGAKQPALSTASKKGNKKHSDSKKTQ